MALHIASAGDTAVVEQPIRMCVWEEEEEVVGEGRWVRECVCMSMSVHGIR